MKIQILHSTKIQSIITAVYCIALQVFPETPTIAIQAHCLQTTSFWLRLDNNNGHIIWQKITSTAYFDFYSGIFPETLHLVMYQHCPQNVSGCDRPIIKGSLLQYKVPSRQQQQGFNFSDFHETPHLVQQTYCLQNCVCLGTIVQKRRVIYLQKILPSR